MRVEVYPAFGNESTFEAIMLRIAYAIAIFYCQYSPVITPLEPLPKVQIPEETNFPCHAESN